MARWQRNDNVITEYYMTVSVNMAESVCLFQLNTTFVADLGSCLFTKHFIIFWSLKLSSKKPWQHRGQKKEAIFSEGKCFKHYL